MVELADFEWYRPAFAITPTLIAQHGFDRSPPDFVALVADAPDRAGRLAGMLIYYLIPFAYRGRPTLYIKELVVGPEFRNQGFGEALVAAACREAVSAKCALIRWQVARWNTAAQRFYQHLGAVADDQWIDYQLEEPAFRRLMERR